jgi:hypothetical protein
MLIFSLLISVRLQFIEEPESGLLVCGPGITQVAEQENGFFLATGRIHFRLIFGQGLASGQVEFHMPVRSTRNFERCFRAGAVAGQKTLQHAPPGEVSQRVFLILLEQLACALQVADG